MSNKIKRIGFGLDPAIENRDGWSRRDFLNTAVLAGAGAFLGLQSEGIATEPPLETDKIRVIEPPEVCSGTPLIVAQELLKGEGFTQLEVKKTTGLDGVNAVAKGDAEFSIFPVSSLITRIDAGESLVSLAGIHIGCFELFGTDRIRSLRDLKGKRVAVS